MKINFSPISYKFSKKEFGKIFKKLSQTNHYTQGKYLQKFEYELSKYFGTTNCVVTSNAVSALEIIVDLLDLDKNDEIIIPAHTYTASAYPFLRKTKKIRWVDIDLKTRVTNIEHIKKRVTKNTKVIVVVHLYGYSVDIKPIQKFAKEKNIILIEDSAQSIGSEINGKKTGTFGDFSIVSFQQQKNLTSLGEGGLLIFKNSKFRKIINQLRHNGHTKFKNQKDYWLPAMSNVEMPKHNESYIIPHNFCLAEVNCITGSLLLSKIDTLNRTKIKKAKYFINKLSSVSDFIKFNEDYSKKNNFHLLVGMCVNINRDSLIRLLFNKYKIQCITQYYPLYKYNFYKNIDVNHSCTNTEIFYKNMISIPFSHFITFKELDYIARSMKSSIKKLIK